MAAPSVTYSFSNASTADATQVNQNFTDLINGASDGTKDYSINALTLASTATLNGDINLGSSSSDLLTVNCSLNSDIPINTNTTFLFGAATKGLLGIYFGGGSTKTTKLVGGTLSGASQTLTLPNALPASQALISLSSSGVFSSRLPSVQVFTSGVSPQTYTTPTGVVCIKVTLIGGGGGGGSNASDGSDGVATTFGTLTAGAGAKGSGAAGTAAGGTGAGGDVNLVGGSGGTGDNSAALCGGYGGNSILGGGGAGAAITGGATGRAGGTNTGGGGGGGGGTNSRGGGGAGGAVIKLITAPSATYTYGVGTGGAAGGTSGGATGGGPGAAGIIIVEEW